MVAVVAVIAEGYFIFKTLNPSVECPHPDKVALEWERHKPHTLGERRKPNTVGNRREEISAKIAQGLVDCEWFEGKTKVEVLRSLGPPDTVVQGPELYWYLEIEEEFLVSYDEYLRIRVDSTGHVVNATIDRVSI